MNKNISFVFFTLNEEKRIEYAIRRLSDYGEILIMDGGSTDKTKEISESLGARFYTRPTSYQPYVETKENFDFIKSKINNDWIYWGYVDNIAPQSLLDKFREITLGTSDIKYVLVPIYTYLWGDTRNYAHKYCAPFFFHKDYVTFSHEHIHGMAQFTGNKKQLLKLPSVDKYALKHFSTYNISKFITGHLKYAETESLQKFQAGRRFSIIRMLAAMVRYCWIYGKYSYKNGTLGLNTIIAYAFTRFMTYAKLYELENNITIESIEKKYSDEKEKLINSKD